MGDPLLEKEAFYSSRNRSSTNGCEEEIENAKSL